MSAATPPREGLLVACGLRLRIDTRQLDVAATGLAVKLTWQETAVMSALLMGTPHVVARERLFTAMYGAFGLPEWAGKCLEVCVHYLRRRLIEARAPCRIVTVYGAGYALRGAA